jgi:sulfhydrogenase subunit beta (sulfur reductase)
MNKSTSTKQTYVLPGAELKRLLDALNGSGYSCIGPTVQDNAIVLDEITAKEDLPQGYVDTQDAASYRLKKNGTPAFFNYVLGPGTWKKFLYPPTEKIFATTRAKVGWKTEPTKEPTQKFAFIGVRPCEIQAFKVLDKVLLEGPFADPIYKARRANVLIVAVNCAKVGGTCFCASMGTGPKATFGFDLALTEIVDGNKHQFVIEAATAKGIEVIEKFKPVPAAAGDIAAADAVSAAAVKKLTKKLDTKGVKELLQANLDHSEWKEVAKRCLSCANCTLVCPTCFCITVEDYTDLQGKSAERIRKWDSCFTMDHSYIHGGSIRYTPDSRYRQWLTHKFSNWSEQYDVSGCVGCGRCITWCPAAIDVTEEISTFQRK